MHRFYLPNLPSTGETSLTPEEAKHAASVLRLQPGDEVELFDGKGGESQATVVDVSKRSVTVTITSPSNCNRELKSLVRAYVSLPKGDRQKTLVDGLTQLGIGTLIPLQTGRSVAQPTSNALQRLRRIVIETSKQCRRNQLMEIDAPVNVDQMGQMNGHRFYAHPYGPCRDLNSVVSAESDQAVSFAIGPEGGFNEEEIALLDAAGWQRISLGPRILRIEIAALATATLFAAAR